MFDTLRRVRIDGAFGRCVAQSARYEEGNLLLVQTMVQCCDFVDSDLSSAVSMRKRMHYVTYSVTITLRNESTTDSLSQTLQQMVGIEQPQKRITFP